MVAANSDVNRATEAKSLEGVQDSRDFVQKDRFPSAIGRGFGGYGGKSQSNFILANSARIARKSQT